MRRKERRHDQATRRMSKSPRAIARIALEIGQAALPPYAHKFSPRRYSQAQLFTCLVLRQFFRTDYRGIVQLLSDWPDLRAAIALARVPHYPTLCYAQRRLLKTRPFHALQRQVFQRARSKGLWPARPTGIIDATGLEARHVSRYYVDRKGYRRFRRRRWPKVTVVGEAHTHLIGGATISWGPSQDSPQLPATVRQAATQARWERLLGDRAYDAEHNHQLCREEVGIRSTVIPLNSRGARKWPQTRYRRQMKRRFLKRIYRQRWQVESLFSRHKRGLGATLRARKWSAQKQECLVRILTHNLMILHRRLSFSTEHSLS
jgi:Transposase DDE domain